jgi:LPS-assembly protein
MRTGLLPPAAAFLFLLLPIGAGWAQDDEAAGEESKEQAESQAGSDTRASAGPSTSQDEIEAPPERITFEVPFPPEKGGGQAVGAAGALEYQGQDLVVATGAVEFNYQSLRLQAERVEVELQTKTLTAEGNVILDDGPRRLSAERLVYNLETQTGTAYEARAFVDPDIFFTGTEISKTGANNYTVTHGTITSCSEDRVPDWSFRLGKARVNVEGFAKVKNTTLRLKKMPLLYSPYLIFPASTDRASGLLFPNIGYSDRRGAILGLAYYQTFGDSYDATIYADAYGEDYYGLGTEFRYRPSHTTSGRFEGFAIDDPIENTTRWKAWWEHTSDSLPFNMRGRVSYRDFSDFDFFRDFERNFNDVSIRSLYSTAYISGNWGSHSLNLLVDERETFIRSDSLVTQRQLPELEYRLRPMQLGKLPLYLQLLTSVNYFQIDRTEGLQASYGRADLAPTLTLPLSYWPWLSVSLSASGRATWYGDSLTDDKQAFRGEELTRTFPSGTVEVIGPSFSRVFEKKLGSFGKFKHIVEPRWTYLFIDEFEDQELVPLFDEVDTFQDRTIIGVSLVNRLLAKPADEASPEGAREILSFEIGQAFSLRDEQPFEQSRDGTMSTTDGPIGALLRFNPSRAVSFETRARYSTLFNTVDQASILSGIRLKNHAFGLTWLVQKDAELDNTRTHQIRFGTDITLVRNRLRMQNQLNYDFVRGFMQQHRHILHYTSQCYGLRLEYRELHSSIRQDTDIRLSLSLKNIGSFFDIGFGSGDEFR